MNDLVKFTLFRTDFFCSEQLGKRWATSLGIWGVGAGTAALFVSPPRCLTPKSRLTEALLAFERDAYRQEWAVDQSPGGACSAETRRALSLMSCILAWQLLRRQGSGLGQAILDVPYIPS